MIEVVIVELKIYDKCKLKDGREGWIVDILGKGHHYIVELDKKGMDDRIIEVARGDIIEKLSL